MSQEQEALDQLVKKIHVNQLQAELLTDEILPSCNFSNCNSHAVVLVEGFHVCEQHAEVIFESFVPKEKQVTISFSIEFENKEESDEWQLQL